MVEVVQECFHRNLRWEIARICSTMSPTQVVWADDGRTWSSASVRQAFLSSKSKETGRAPAAGAARDLKCHELLAKYHRNVVHVMYTIKYMIIERYMIRIRSAVDIYALV